MRAILAFQSVATIVCFGMALMNMSLFWSLTAIVIFFSTICTSACSISGNVDD